MFQPGRGYNFTTSNGVSTLDIDADWPLPAEPDQFQVSVFKGAESWGVQCRKGFVNWLLYRANDPFVNASAQAEVRKFFAFPTGSKTTGDAATVADSSLVDLGGFISINPASVEGGSDSWGVYIIGCANLDVSIVPYLAIMADGSDAEVKSRYFNGASDQIIVRNVLPYDSLEVETPTGTTLINYAAGGTLYPYNYNCQRYKVATLTWEDDTFIVDQKLLGQFTMPYPINHQGDYPYIAEDGPPVWTGSPYYSAQWEDWLGVWSGYTKDSSGATVEV
jgi:hypothetical protein